MPSPAITSSMVFELLGRSMYICNSIELRIKWLLLNSSGCGPIVFSTPEDLKPKLKAIQQKKNKLCKQPLGNVWKEVLELIYKVPTQKEFDEAEAEAAKENKFVFKIIHCLVISDIHHFFSFFF